MEQNRDAGDGWLRWTKTLLCDHHWIYYLQHFTFSPSLHSYSRCFIYLSIFMRPCACCFHLKTYMMNPHIQVLLLPSSVTLDTKGDPNGLKLLLMIWESLKSIFLPSSTQFQTWKTRVSSSQYMCLSSIDATTIRPIHTNASNLFPLQTASVSTPQGRSGYRATVWNHSKLAWCQTFSKKKFKTETWKFLKIHCEKAFCMVLHLFSWRFSHRTKSSLSFMCPTM